MTGTRAHFDRNFRSSAAGHNGSRSRSDDLARLTLSTRAAPHALGKLDVAKCLQDSLEGSRT